LTEEWVRTIWKRAILPYIEEQFVGEERQLDRFDLELLRKAEAKAATAGDGADDASSSAP
jgi:hypothetical protein